MSSAGKHPIWRDSKPELTRPVQLGNLTSDFSIRLAHVTNLHYELPNSGLKQRVRSGSGSPAIRAGRNSAGHREADDRLADVRVNPSREPVFVLMALRDSAKETALDIFEG